MTLQRAIKIGKKITRPHWLTFGDPKELHYSYEDLVATDWRVFIEKKVLTLEGHCIGQPGHPTHAIEFWSDPEFYHLPEPGTVCKVTVEWEE
jgi:hypothetical protein